MTAEDAIQKLRELLPEFKIILHPQEKETEAVWFTLVKDGIYQSTAIPLELFQAPSVMADFLRQDFEVATRNLLKKRIHNGK